MTSKAWRVCDRWRRQHEPLVNTPFNVGTCGMVQIATYGRSDAHPAHREIVKPNSRSTQMLTRSLLTAIFTSITVAGLALPAQAAPVSVVHGAVTNASPLVATVADRHHQHAPVARHGHRSGHSAHTVRQHGHVQAQGHGHVQVHADRHAPRHGHQRRHGH